MLVDQPRLLHLTSMALLCHWRQQLRKDMTSLGTNFEMHAIWQGYVEEPAAKDFVERNACTIALSKARGSCHRTSNNQPFFTSLEIPWGFLTRAILRKLAGIMLHEKVEIKEFCE
jgi:hypothetical protein